MTCKLCEQKKAKRQCLPSGGEICPSCCAAGREITIECPLDCVYLQESRFHEKPPPIPVETIPNRDIEVTEDFLRRQEPLLMWLSMTLMQAMVKGNAVDSDAKEGLAALIQTYRTKNSGLIYESRPANPYAAAIQESLRESIADIEKRAQQELTDYALRDADVLGVLVFLERMALQYANGRRRGRAFLDFLRASFPMPKPTENAA